MLKEAAKELQAKRANLNGSYKTGAADSYMEQNSALLDAYFKEAWERTGSTRSERFAIVAVGGYGRMEQAPFSDVDLMFLYNGRVPDEAAVVVRDIVYPLWDIKLDVGYATRAIEEALRMGLQDMEIFTSFLNMRFVCGEKAIYDRFEGQLRQRMKSGKKRLTKQLVASCVEREEKYSDSSGLLEPDLKNGPGGLRDYHAMAWMDALEKGPGLKPLNGSAFGLAGYEYEALKEALRFLWDARNHLHMITARKSDRVFYEFHEPVSRAMGFTTEQFSNPAEAFIGMLHEKTATVRNIHRIIFSGYIGEKPFFLSRKRFNRIRVDGLTSANRLLGFSSAQKLRENPELMLQIFAESSRLKMHLSAGAKRVIRENSEIVSGRSFRKNTARDFETIMAQLTPDFNVLSEMLNTGFLYAYIPGFEGIKDKVQYNNYHIYPVDRHTVQVLSKIRNFAGSRKKGLYTKLYEELSHKRVLHWAALLHDIGKGEDTGEHAETGAGQARAILKEMGVPENEADDVVFLIHHHLFLINLARRRDIEDEETALFCAGIVKSAERMKMLYLLTVADSKATGPNAWNEWTEGLLKRLFFRASEVITKGSSAVGDRGAPAVTRERVIGEIRRSGMRIDDPESLIYGMSNRYLGHHNTEAVMKHLQLYQQMEADGLAIDFHEEAEDNHLTVTICTRAGAGFFSGLAGVFTLNNFDILDAQIYSWGKGVVLDIFTIRPFYDLVVGTFDTVKLTAEIRSVQTGRRDLAEALQSKKDHPFYKKQVSIAGAENRVETDNESSGFYTLIEVFTHDAPGLLFSLTNKLYENGIDIVYAKITTHVEQVVDVFYVRDMNGGKIEDEKRLTALKKQLLDVIDK